MSNLLWFLTLFFLTFRLRYEQIFVYNLLLHLHCDEIDPQYKPVHGLGAIVDAPLPKKGKSRSRH